MFFRKRQFLNQFFYFKTIHTVEVAASERIWQYFGDLTSKLVSTLLASQVERSGLA